MIAAFVGTLLVGGCVVAVVVALLAATSDGAGRAGLRAVWRWLRRVLRTAHGLARDRRLPWWLRLLFLLGCVQIPVLPFDEMALVLAVGILAVFHRGLLAEHWQRTAVTA